MRLGLVQLDPVWEDAAASLKRLEALVEHAPPCDLLLLPEMALTGFTMVPAKAELSDAHHAVVSALAARTGASLGYGGGAPDGSNRLWVRSPDGSLLCDYAKRHLFRPGGEADAYRAGPSAPVPFALGDWRVLPSICYDLRFPYQFWAAGTDADLVALVASWPAARARHWRILLQARAVENQCWVAAVNRVGSDPRTRHAGGSLVVDPDGRIVFEAPDEEGIFPVEMDLGLVAERRRKLPVVADRLE